MRGVTDRLSYALLLVLGMAFVLAFLLIRLPRARDGLISIDGPGYFSYLPSIIFDHDLDFQNEFAYFGWSRPTVASTGLVDNPWSVGPAVFWAPFYLAAHAIAIAAQSVALPQMDTDGLGRAYQSAVCIGTITYVTAGCFITYRICRRYYSPRASLLAVLGVSLATSLTHYIVPAPAMSHGLSFFTVALFVCVWHPPRSRTCGGWALVGFCAGLMTLVRWQNLLYAIVILVEAVQAFRAGPKRGGSAVFREYVGGGLLATIVGALTISPQLLAWYALYGSPLAIPQGAGFFDWLHPNLLEYLFSTRHGLFTWHPVTLLATLGLIPLWRRDRTVALALVSALLVQWYFNSAVAAWWAGDAFGARRFISATPLLALGFAAITEHVTYRFRRGPLLVVGSLAVLVVWNILFDLQYSWGFISWDQGLSLRQLTVGKLDMIVDLIQRGLK